MHQDYAILKRQDNIDAYFKDIEKIYVSNGWGSSYPEGLLRQMFSASYYLLATTTSGAVGFLRGFTDGAMVTHLSEIVVDPGLQRRGIGRLLMQKFLQDIGHTTIYAEALNPQAALLCSGMGLRVPEPEGVFKKKSPADGGKPMVSPYRIAGHGGCCAWELNRMAVLARRQPVRVA